MYCLATGAQKITGRSEWYVALYVAPLNYNYKVLFLPLVSKLRLKDKWNWSGAKSSFKTVDKQGTLSVSQATYCPPQLQLYELSPSSSRISNADSLDCPASDSAVAPTPSFLPASAICCHHQLSPYLGFEQHLSLMSKTSK